jgi:CRISPR/Cas system-associated exonuclease Cas4 (RecB family)
MSLTQFNTLSQSSLQDYVDCPRRLQLRYIEQLSYPASESEPALENEKHQQEGEYFHRLVQQHLIGIPEDKLTRLANTPNLSRWWSNFISDTSLKELNQALVRYAEASLSSPLGKFRLVAKYDLIVLIGDKIIVYDWKTYRKRPKNEWLASRWQTRVYCALLAQAGAHLLNNGKSVASEQIEMNYWFSEFPSDPAHFQYSAAQFKRDWVWLEKLADEIANASSFPQTEDRQKCSYCPYRSYCDRGIRAGDLADAEGEVEAEELFDINLEQIGEIAF